MRMFPQDYERLKTLIDKAIQGNKDFLHFKGVKLHIDTAKRTLGVHNENS